MLWKIAQKKRSGPGPCLNRFEVTYVGTDYDLMQLFEEAVSEPDIVRNDRESLFEETVSEPDIVRNGRESSLRRVAIFYNPVLR